MDSIKRNPEVHTIVSFGISAFYKSMLHVKRLRRVREHTLSLGALPEGGWRELTADEVRAFEQEK